MTVLLTTDDKPRDTEKEGKLCEVRENEAKRKILHCGL